jgi:mRNA-degrading endonuclease RelE of RelBE toxin-antitoxin system
MAKVYWPESVLEVLSELPERERQIILEKVTLLERFPRMFPIRPKGRFRNHRWFLARDWIVYYRFREGNVYIRGLWPARIP